MRLARIEDITRLQQVYTEATQHGNSVGRVAWPERFPRTVLEQYVKDEELYCFEADGRLVGVVRLSEAKTMTNIWPSDGAKDYLYISRLATSNHVRGQQYLETIMLPAIATEAQRRGKIGLRLDCQTDSPGLMKLYKKLDFTYLEAVSIISKLAGEPLTVACFERRF